MGAVLFTMINECVCVRLVLSFVAGVFAIKILYNFAEFIK